jgi:hypothetical protein
VQITFSFANKNDLQPTQTFGKNKARILLNIFFGRYHKNIKKIGGNAKFLPLLISLFLFLQHGKARRFI